MMSVDNEDILTTVIKLWPGITDFTQESFELCIAGSSKEITLCIISIKQLVSYCTVIIFLEIRIDRVG